VLLRVAAALFTFLVVGALVGGSPASAASGCPTQTFLSFDHLGYAATSVPAAIRLPTGSGLGGGTVDEPTSADGCRRVQRTVQVQAAGSIQPPVAVLVRGRPRTLFVIGHRCEGYAGPSYWDCLLKPLVFHGRQFTGTSYPSTPARRKTLSLGATIGDARYRGHKVTVRRITGVSPSVAVGISGQPSAAFLSPRTCPYSGFSNSPQYDDLLRCLRSPVWFTFDPPGSQAGATVVARSDRRLSGPVTGASISLVRLPVVADFVPAHRRRLVPDGRVGEQVSIRMPDVPAGLYEAVVSCPRCESPSSAGTGLYPAGSILLTAKPKTSLGIKIVSYALPVAFVAAAILAFMTWRRRRRLRAAAGG
jgi:hypothetical protein